MLPSVGRLCSGSQGGARRNYHYVLLAICLSSWCRQLPFLFLLSVDLRVRRLDAQLSAAQFPEPIWHACNRKAQAINHPWVDWCRRGPEYQSWTQETDRLVWGKENRSREVLYHASFGAARAGAPHPKYRIGAERHGRCECVSAAGLRRTADSRRAPPGILPSVDSLPPSA